MYKYNNYEFNRLIKPIIENDEFQLTKEITHHGITRYEHSLRVAYYSYLVTKLMRLDYKETTIAAMLHDFFINETSEDNAITKLIKHPNYAVENAKKYFELSEKQEDIIKTHMFPVTIAPPKYLESWIVDIVDDIAAIYERSHSVKKGLQAAATFMFVLMISIIKIR